MWGVGVGLFLSCGEIFFWGCVCEMLHSYTPNIFLAGGGQTRGSIQQFKHRRDPRKSITLNN